MRFFGVIATLVIVTGAGFGQSLTLSSASAAAGSTVSLGLSLSAPSGSQPAALEWTFSYPTASIASVAVTAGPAAVAAGKSIACAGAAAGYTCIVYGLNSTSIANGVAAVANFTLTSSATTSSIGVSNVVAASAAGAQVSTSGTGGAITIASLPGVSSVSCNPASLGPSASSSCTLSLSAVGGPAGVAVALSSNSASLTVPASVTVPAGSKTAMFTARSGSFTSNQTATITASLNGSSATASVALNTPERVTGLQCGATTLVGNSNTSCTITLSAPAPAGGVVIAVSTNALSLLTPSSVTIPAGATTASFTASTSSIAAPLTATVTASFSGSFLTTTVSLVSGSVISSLQCAPSSLTPGASATCTATVNPPAPAGGAVITLTDNSSALTTPASANIPANSSSASFTVTAGSFTAPQAASVTASAGGNSANVTVPLVTANTAFFLNGDSTEASGLTNGSALHPAYDPAGLPGSVVANGTGSVNFVTGKGVYFLTCCSNTNDAYYKFTGAAVGNVFGVSNGQISFTLTSRYSFAQRQANAAASRYAFDVRDANGHQFYFLTGVTSGKLVFTYSAAGVPAYYYVPAGSEDALFGNGVSLNVTIKWDGSTASLLLNGQTVHSAPYTPVTAYWTSASIFDVGAYEYQTSGGYSVLDDIIGQFSVSTGVLLQIHGNSTELAAVTNGSAVTPAIAPSGLTGHVVVNGAGSVNFVSGGVYFVNCCTNTNNAYFKFNGAEVGNIFNIPQGQVSFSLQSRYSFAQRQSSAAAPRYAFDARDANGHQFYFLTEITGGRLVFTYLVQGVANYYYVPAGTEDQLFGSGVTLNVALTWNGSTENLVLNGTTVKSASYTPAAQNWTSASIFDLGAYEYLTAGGYNSSDDLIREFTVIVPPPAATAAVAPSRRTLLAFAAPPAQWTGGAFAYAF